MFCGRRLTFEDKIEGPCTFDPEKNVFLKSLSQENNYSLGLTYIKDANGNAYRLITINNTNESVDSLMKDKDTKFLIDGQKLFVVDGNKIKYGFSDKKNEFRLNLY